MNGSQYGMIRGIAQIWIFDQWAFRVLVMSVDCWEFLYVGASNYRFGIGDIVSWGEGVLYWHANNQTMKFDLLQTGVATK